jgi:uncharacterized protein (TIGR00645 family)
MLTSGPAMIYSRFSTVRAVSLFTRRFSVTHNHIESLLKAVGSALYALRSIMSLFYIGLAVIMCFILFQFVSELVVLTSKLGTMGKMDLIIKVLELVDMTMVAQLVWVVALAGYSLFVTSGHFEKPSIAKPDWLDHVNTYNLKLKLAFAIISISGVHTLKTFLQGRATTEEMLTLIAGHLVFVLCAIGIALAERFTREK